MKRLKSLKFLFFFGALSLCLMSNAASVTVNVDNLRYTVDTEANTAELYGPVNTSTVFNNLVIPDYITYNDAQIPVTSIRSSAFISNKNLTGSLSIGNNVQTIGNSAFYSCSGFNGSLTIGNNVQTIGERAFRYCSGFTGSLTIPNNVEAIGQYAFANCSGFTGSLTISNSLQTISICAFGGCSGLSGDLIIPNSIQKIEISAFESCSGFNGSLIIGNSVQIIGGAAFDGCSGLTGLLTIPNTVQNIGASAFRNCNKIAGSLIIPESVQIIQKRAFQNCSGFNGSLTIGNSVQTIDDETFSGCSGFTGSLTIGNSVKTIGRSAFEECSGFTGSLTIGDNVQTIGNFAFQNCKFSDVKSYALTPAVAGIYAFYNFYSSPLYVPAESINLYKAADEWKNFRYINPLEIEATDIKLNKSELELLIGESETLIATLTPEDATTEIVWSVVDDNPIISIDQSGKVTALAVGEAIVKATAGEVSAICKVTVLLPENAEIELDDIIYIVETRKGTAYCKGPRVQSLVKNGVILKDVVEFANQTFPVVSIANSAFEGCTGLSGQISLGDNMTAIGEYAFKGCVNIEGLFFPKALTNIGYDAFKGCIGLEIVMAYYTEWFNINFQNNYSNPLSQGADLSFLDTTSIGSVLVIPIWVNEVKPYAFWGWSKFQGTVEFPGTVKIGRAAFVNCSGIINVKFTNSLKTIEYGAFSQCSGLTGELKIPDSVTSIENIAFAGCTNLTSIVLGSSLTSLGYNNLMGSTFGDCPNIEKVISKAVVPPTCYGTNQFYNEVYQKATLYVPFVSVEAYKEAKDWKQFKYITFIPEEASSIKLDREVVELHIEETIKLNATIEPASAIDTPITWSSSNSSVAIVNDMGEVTAIGLGTTTITVSTSNNLSASCEVTVNPILAASISIDGGDIHTLKQTETLQLTATVNPENTTYQEIAWQSSDNSKASVSPSGLVTALEEGEVEITASLIYQSDIKATYKITIEERILGDANDNGVVNVADVGAISDYIVQKPVYNFCFVNADVITDARITTADVTATVDIIFNDTPSLAKFAKARKMTTYESNELIISNFTSPTSVVKVRLKNPSEFTGLQGSILIPTGVTVKNVTKGTGAVNHILNYNITESGSIEFILYSLQNSLFADGAGSLIELEIEAGNSCGDIIVNNILASDNSATEYSLSYSGGVFSDLNAVTDIINGNIISIYPVLQGIVILNGQDETINVFDVTGKRIRSTKVISNKELYLIDSGMYIVTVGDKTEKIIVK